MTGAKQTRLSRPIHPMPAFVRAALRERGLTAAYRARPDYQRNDYIGWIVRAKREATQRKRLAQMLDELEAGDLYMKMAWRGGAVEAKRDAPGRSRAGAAKGGASPVPASARGRASRMEQVRTHALSLPETVEAPHFEFTSFRVAKRIFATAPPEGAHLHVFVDDDEREPLAGEKPEAYELLRWGGKVVGLRVHLAKADLRTVKRLLESAWRRKAPRRLVDAAARPTKARARRARAS